jgi:cytoskeletal protein CcmA (bactofilin family)
MFEFSKKGPMADTQLTYSTTIGAKSSIDGNFSHYGNMLLLGSLKGDIVQEGDSSEAKEGFTAVIGKTGYLEGNIHSSHAIIIGRIEGSVYAKGRVEVYPGAIVHGDITYSQINVHPDARVDGNLKCLLSESLDQAGQPQNLGLEKSSNVLPMTKVEGL